MPRKVLILRFSRSNPTSNTSINCRRRRLTPCSLQELEDLYHLLISCPVYSPSRSAHLHSFVREQSKYDLYFLFAEAL